MGKNLSLNIESRGYSVSVFNRSSEKTDLMVEESKGKIFIERTYLENSLIL
ncbi:NAD(P)-binding domain-containing protein [Staphylococcus aureus]